MQNEVIENFSVRHMTRHEADIAIMWAKEEGWNPGLEDAECFYSADPDGFFIGCVGKMPVCCMSVVNYGEAYAFAGFYIVRPEFRGRGYGSMIFSKAMSHADDRNVGGDGVVGMQAKYKQRYGFTLSHKNIRYMGTPLHNKPGSDKCGIGTKSCPDTLVMAGDVSFDEIFAYDSLHVPSPRKHFLKKWISQKYADTVVMLGKDESITGYATMRKCYEGYKVGPLFADDRKIAKDLFDTLRSQAKDSPVFLDVPQPNQYALDMAKRCNMTPVFETGRIYSKEDPGLPLTSIYGITSYELG